MTAERNWLDPSYLQHGNARQREAWRALQTLRIFETLKPYSPVLCGTIPLDLEVPGTDLDIICEANDLTAFAHEAQAAYGSIEQFTLRQETVKGTPSVMASFEHGGFLLEVFGQPRPVEEQNAYRHMVVEARLLAVGGEAARQAIRQLKQTGLKTEPAFAQYFGLEGDPYDRLLELYDLDNEALRQAIRA